MNTLPLVIDPVALQLGPVRLTWYGMILGLGAVLGLVLAVREGKRFDISPDFFMDLLLIGVPMAIIGARTYYVAFEWEHYKGDWYEILAVWHGGLAIHGALIGAMLAGILYTRAKKAPFWRIADIAAPSLIAGQMIGRWGNFVNQEAHGGPVPREFLSDTLHLPDWIVNQMQIGDTYYHPTFLYESVWNFTVLLLLLWLRRRPWLRAGELFLGYFALYSLGRFFIEGLRTDSLAFHGPYWLEKLLAALWLPMRLLFDAGDLPPGGGNVRTAQFISLLLILTAAVLIIVRRVGGFASQRYLDPIVIGSAGAGAAGGDADGAAGGGGEAAPGGTGETSGGAAAAPSADGTSGDGKRGQDAFYGNNENAPHGVNGQAGRGAGTAAPGGAGVSGGERPAGERDAEGKAEGGRGTMFGWLSNRKRRSETDGLDDDGKNAAGPAKEEQQARRREPEASPAEQGESATREQPVGEGAGPSGSVYTPPRYEPGNPLL